MKEKKTWHLKQNKSIKKTERRNNTNIETELVWKRDRGMIKKYRKRQKDIKTVSKNNFWKKKH